MSTEPKYIVALDQGTTSSRAVVLDHDANIVTVANGNLRRYTTHRLGRT